MTCADHGDILGWAERMCGIAGLYSADLSPETTKPMIRSMLHRGPDDLGFWSASNVSLGHCRLAIIDPVHGRQPMRVRSTSGATAIVCFGGEIFNYKHLRAQLSKLGHEFRTESDTEVLGRAYLEWGPSSFERLRGMYAFAVYDELRHRLILCRDQLGIKPLYVKVTPGAVLFSSEIRGIAAATSHMDIDIDGACELLGLWPYRSPTSGILRGVDELGPGMYMSVDANGVRIAQYWQLIQREYDESFDVSAERVRAMLSTSVEEQLAGDVPLTALLSGGIDSSSVIAIAAEKWGRAEPLRAYTLYLPESDVEFVPSAFRPERDLPFAVEMAQHLDIALRRVALSDSEVVSAESAMTTARDMPDNGDLDITLNALFSALSDGYKACLTGEGADELFGGYPWAANSSAVSLDKFPWLDALCFPLEFVTAPIRAQVIEFQAAAFRSAIANAPLDVGGLNPAQARRRLISYLDIVWFLPGQLERMDRVSMWNGVEARVPFCTPELADLCWNMPIEQGEYADCEKSLLRRAVADLLPARILTRRKTSYPTVNGSTYELHLRRSVRKVLDDRDWPLMELLDLEAVGDALAGRRPPPASRPSIWLGQVWSLYRWAKQYNVEYVA